MGLFLIGCGKSDRVPPPGASTSAMDRQTAFRVRADFHAPLNEDRGWAAGTNESATVSADEPFRLRFEVETTGSAGADRRFQLQVRRNDGPWEPLGAENFPNPIKALELDFSDSPEEPLASVWTVVEGADSSLSWQAGGNEGHLRFEAGDEATLALAQYETGWEPREFSAILRLPDAGTARAGLVFGYEHPGNYLRVDLEAGEAVEVVRVVGGRESIIATHPIAVKRGQWFELKVIFEGRLLTVEYDDDALIFNETLEREIPSSVAGLHVAKESSVHLQSLAVEGTPRSPRSSIMASAAFLHGAPTEDLLAGSARPFSGGAGISFADTTPPWSADAGHGEWEFPIVIRRFSDEAALNEAGDRFDFRMADERGIPLETDALASVTLEVPHGHLGGTFVETPMRVGPWQAGNGDLYFLMEPSETWNLLMTVKSSDGGASWREMDGAHRPQTGDLEGFASVLVGDRIHMLHQTSDDVWYHAFNTSDHPREPDIWAVRDERLASPEEPPTQVADLAVRSDGSVVAVYGGPRKIHFRTRSPSGEWSEETVMDANLEPDLSGPSLVLGRDDVIHLAYTGNDGTAWHRKLSPEGELSERTLVAEGLGTRSEDVGSILPLVYLADSDTVSLIYRLAHGQLWERRWVGPDGHWSEPVRVTDRAVAQNTVDSDQTGADAIAYRDGIQLLFIEEESGHLYHTERRGEGEWTPSKRLIDDEQVQWVRGGLVKRSGEAAVYGYVFDGGSDGGSGMNQYRELPLE
jgi:hypothetical protein